MPAPSIPAASPAPPRPPWIGQTPRLLTARVFRVLFVSPDATFVSHRHRVVHQAAYLARRGVETAVLALHDLPEALHTVALWDVVVVFRSCMEPPLDALYATCRRAGVPIAYDVDDLVFEPDLVTPALVDTLRLHAPNEVVDSVAAAARYRQALLGADACVVTTEPLAARGRALGMATFVVPNGVPPEQPPPDRRAPRPEVVLGYFSGTRSHQRDFAVVVPVLVRLMTALPHVRLRVVGEVNLREFPELAPVLSHVEQRPLTTPAALVAEIADVDVNLAPLEIENPFCQAKSPLKWLEAAAVGVPTVASSTVPFAEAIRDGETGLLARTEAEWTAALERLVRDAELRARVGQAAQRDAVQRFGADAVAAIAHRAYASVVEAARGRFGASCGAVDVTFVLETHHPEREGVWRMLVLADALAGRGHEVRVTVRSTPDEIDACFRALRDGGWLRRVRFAGPVAELVTADAILATSLATVAAVAEHRRRCARAFALGVPGAAGVEAIRWGDGDAAVPLFVEHARYTGDPARGQRDWVLCRLRGEGGEGENALALAALARVAAAGRLGGRRIVVFGGGSGQEGGLPFPGVDLGWRPVEELPAFYRRAAVGIVLDAGVPSTVGLSMLACGCPVVALETAEAARGYGGHASLAAADAAAIAAAVEALLADDAAAEERAVAAQRYAGALPSPEDAAARLEALLRGALAD
ncbi:MAG: glycosyltransferase family 4 protein [Candidatus Binatia bacterium]